MKVAFLTGSLSRNSGGLFTSVRRLSQSMRSDGNEVAVFGYDDEHYAEDKAVWGEPAPTALSRTPYLPIAHTPALRHELSQFQPDVIHPQFIWMYSSWACLQHSRRYQTPYIIAPRGMLDPWAVNNSRWKKRLAGWLFEHRHLQSARCFHALCRSEAESIRGFGLKNPICIIPNGVDLTAKPPAKEPPWKSQLPADAKIMLFLGRVHPKKGLPAFLEAWALSPATRDWCLVVGGWSQLSHDEELQQLAQELGIAERIHFTGGLHGDEKHAAFSAADAFVLPSLSEGLPISVLEAWSYRLPCLLTDTCNLPEGFDHRAAHRLPLPATTMSRALGEFCTMSAAELHSMGDRGYELVKQSFTWRSISERMGKVYQWMADGGKQPQDVEFY